MSVEEKIEHYVYKPTWVANTFLKKGNDESISIDHLKIQKLLYNFHGWHLAITGLPAVGEYFEAWPKGPVLSSLYQKFKSYKWNNITKYALDIDPATGEEISAIVPAADEQFYFIFNAVWERYKNFSGIELSAMTHAKGTPWTISRDAGLQYIENDLIRQYFIELGKKAQ
jgi:uncharacterized phage-associated protein